MSVYIGICDNMYDALEHHFNNMDIKIIKKKNYNVQPRCNYCYKTMHHLKRKSAYIASTTTVLHNKTIKHSYVQNKTAPQSNSFILKKKKMLKPRECEQNNSNLYLLNAYMFYMCVLYTFISFERYF